MRRKNKRNILAAAVLAALLCCGCSGQEPFSENTAGEEEACKITDLTVNYMQNPIGIEQNPLFGWRMQAKGLSGKQPFGRHGLCVEGICLGRGWKYDREHGDRGV